MFNYPVIILRVSTEMDPSPRVTPTFSNLSVLVKLTLWLWGCQGDGYLNLFSEQDFPTFSRFLSSLALKSEEMWEKYLGLLNVSGLCHVHYSISDKLNVIRALANRFLFSCRWNTNDWSCVPLMPDLDSRVLTGSLCSQDMAPSSPGRLSLDGNLLQI